jgi:DNA polymerase I-like protein with 3'-5' exonuclease and polymerase domains
VRGLIKPPPGHAFFYPDWRAMEFGIAAALSGDQKMQAAYRTGDCYLAFAKQAGAASPDATKETHPGIREQYKACVLGVQYGIGLVSLADRIRGSQSLARELLNAHKRTYTAFWHWSDMVVSEAMFHNFIRTAFGWTLHIVQGQNKRSLMNFPMQANGAEIMRVPLCLMVERGIPVGGVVHDAFAICCPVDQLEACMAAAGRRCEKHCVLFLAGLNWM